jgi:Undecaprenyl-phosphate galactose phosphotransferase WbaP
MTISEFESYIKDNYPRTSSFVSGLALFFVDALVLIFCIGLGFFIVNLFTPNAINFKSFINYTIYIPLILLFFGCIGLYPGIMNSPTEEVRKFFFSSLFSFISIIFTIIVSEENELRLADLLIKDSHKLPLAIAFIIAIPLSTVALPAFREAAKHYFGRFRWWGVPAVLFTTDKSGLFIIDKLLKNKYLGYHPSVIIDSNAKESSEYKGIPIFPPDADIIETLKKHNIKQALICDYHGDMSDVMASFRYTITVSKNQNFFTATQQLKDIAGIIGFASIHNLTFKGNLILKRLIDIIAIILCLPFLLPVFLVLSFLVKVTSRGPIFYAHKRVGKNGKEIKCWKFRSMCINSQEILEKILATDPVRRAEWEKDRKFLDDPRVTKFGKFLRRTSLDELPQLFNILAGDMSLVGPRPVTEPELVKYGKYKDYVLSVVPGLTGMWQVSGRSDTGYEERISFDTYYIQNWSIFLDIWILIKTVWVVINGKGAY